MKQHQRFFIGGEWVQPKGANAIDVTRSSTGQPMGSVVEGTPEDADRAVRAARAAFDGWSATPAGERAQALRRLAEGVRNRADDLAALIAGEVGMPLAMAKMIQVFFPASVLSSTADLLEGMTLNETVGHSEIVREPVGVVAAITPWNYPLHQLIAKAAPALAAGCPVVSKPSEVAPLTAFAFAEIVAEADLPPGVFNMICGYGPVVGEALATHEQVDMISFTGSTRAGKRVAALAAESVKRVTLELGGKSPSVILDDADLKKAVKGTVNNCFLNSGQTCSAWTRMLVPASMHDEAAALAGEAAARFTVGDPMGGEAKLGPLVSAAQRERVLGFVRRAIDEGARLVAGDPNPPRGLGDGFFVTPAVLSEVTPEMTIAREEVFGPVLAIMPYRDEDDAVRIANATEYGLAAGVWSGDARRARRVAGRIRSGQVDINGASFNPMAPFGGFKQSGYGRELGRFGIEEYLELKSIQA